MLKWKQEFAIGVAMIDEQHKILFEIVNRAYELLIDESCNDKHESIIFIMDELKDYTAVHLKTEEDYMEAINCKSLSEHKVKHMILVQKINSIDFEKMERDQNKYLTDILGFISTWIIEHMLMEDKRIIE